MPRPVVLTPGQVSVLRGAVATLAADSGTLSDANYPPTAALNFRLYDSIFIGVEIAGGTSPTMNITPLFRDDGAADQSRWRKILVGANPGVTLGAAVVQTTGLLAADLTMVEIMVFGAEKVFLQINAVGGTVAGTTSWNILGLPGRARNSGHFPRG